MGELFYMTGGSNNRFFKIQKKKNKKTGKIYGEVSRISCSEYNDNNKNIKLGLIKPKVGDNVMIIIKPYYKYNCKTGIVKDVLTRSEIHTRGHKVRLISGEIGRVLKILS